MNIISLISTVLAGIFFFIIYFRLFNFILDYIIKYKIISHRYENSIRSIIFIAPAFLVLFTFILFPVFETIRLSFYDKFGREFIGLNNYFWAIKDTEFRRSILNNLGWLLIVPTLSTFFGLVIANLTDRIWWGTIAKSIIFRFLKSIKIVYLAPERVPPKGAERVLRALGEVLGGTFDADCVLRD